MNLIYAAIVVFGITALGGIFLLSFILRDKQAPKSIALVHGLLGASGIGLLIYYASNNTLGPLLATGILVVAAFGGITMGYRQYTGNAVPKWLAVSHGIVAIVGLVFY